MPWLGEKGVDHLMDVHLKISDSEMDILDIPHFFWWFAVRHPKRALKGFVFFFQLSF